MSVAASVIFAEAARVIGSRTGVVLAGSTQTSVLLDGLVGTVGSNTAYSGQRLILPAEASNSDKERLVTAWTDATGAATVPLLSGAPTAGDPYILVPPDDYTLNEYRLAFGKCLNETPRTYRRVFPFTPLLRNYPFDAFDLKGDGDIDAAYYTLSPLMLHNDDMSLWQNGTDSAPDGFTFTDSGTGGTVVRVSGGVRSNYAARITSGNGIVRLTQTIPSNLVNYITRRTNVIFTQMRGAGWCSTTDTGAVRIFIYDGTTRHYASAVAGTGVPSFPTLSLTPDGSMTAFTWGIEVAAGSKSVDLSWAGLMQNTTSFDEWFSGKDSGSQSYTESTTAHAVRNVGGLPIVELQYLPAIMGQLILYVRRPFPDYVSDADEYDDAYKRVLVAGTVNFLLQAQKPQQDRARLDRIRLEQARIWTRLIANQADSPVPAPPTRVDVWPG